MSATNGASPGGKKQEEPQLLSDGDRDEGAPGVLLRCWLAVVRWTLRRTDWNLITDADIDGIAQTAFTSGCELGRRQQTARPGLPHPAVPRAPSPGRHRW